MDLFSAFVYWVASPFSGRFQFSSIRALHPLLSVGVLVGDLESNSTRVMVLLLFLDWVSTPCSGMELLWFLSNGVFEELFGMAMLELQETLSQDGSSPSFLLSLSACLSGDSVFLCIQMRLPTSWYLVFVAASVESVSLSCTVSVCCLRFLCWSSLLASVCMDVFCYDTAPCVAAISSFCLGCGLIAGVPWLPPWFVILFSPDLQALQIACDVALLGLVMVSRLYVLELFDLLLLTAVLGVATICSLDCTAFSFLKMAGVSCQCLLECPNGSQFSCMIC
ncbi:hypothetical protein Peur_021331 [Populus x canadensis]